MAKIKPQFRECCRDPGSDSGDTAKSVRSVFGDITNTSNYGSVYRGFRFDLKMFPYSLSIMQHLKETDLTVDWNLLN